MLTLDLHLRYDGVQGVGVLDSQLEEERVGGDAEEAEEKGEEEDEAEDVGKTKTEEETDAGDAGETETELDPVHLVEVLQQFQSNSVWFLFTWILCAERTFLSNLSFEASDQRAIDNPSHKSRDCHHCRHNSCLGFVITRMEAMVMLIMLLSHNDEDVDCLHQCSLLAWSVL